MDQHPKTESGWIRGATMGCGAVFGIIVALFLIVIVIVPFVTGLLGY